MRGEITRSTGPRGGVIEITVSAAEREGAFRRARRHTALVKILKVLLPATAVVCVGYYAATLVISSSLKSHNITAGKITVDPANLTMANPHYSGFGKDGSEYKVKARSAVSDLRMAAPIRLDQIDGEIIQPTGVVTHLKAKWGTYDQKKELLELYEKIDVDATNGMRARLTRATVLAKESRIISDEPVHAETTTGEIRARTMTLDTKSRKANFRDDVRVTLKPTNPATALRGSEGGALPKRDTQAFAIATSSDEPVVVTSRLLDVDDAAKTALFREAVVARQGEAVLEAPELDVIYAGRSAIGDVGGGAATAASGEAGTKLKSIRARGGVQMASKDDRAESRTLDYDAETERVTLEGSVVMTQVPGRRVTADSAVLDQRADTALLVGEVVVTQDRNVLRGGRLAIDRKVGALKLANPAADGRGAGRISTVFYPSATRTAGGSAAKSSGEGDEASLNPLGTSFKSDPNAPVEVEALTLDVNDRKHTATYVGAVVAKQGPFVVRTEEMIAHYTGESGLAGDTRQPGRDKAKAGASGGTELKRIEARRGVVVTGNDGQQAQGEWAIFDVKANTVVMGGNVTVSQGKQLVRAPAGMRLLIDLGSGVTRFEADPAASARAGPKVSGAFATSVAPGPQNSAAAGCPPGAVCKSGRLEAIFYPNQIKEKAGEAVGSGRASEGAAAAQDLAKRAPSGSAWRATTAPPKAP